MEKEIRPSYIRCKPGEKCDILFFGESPGDEENLKGEAFVGPAGKLLRQVIEHHFPDRKIVLDNTVPIYLGGAKPKKKEIDKFEDYREKSLTHHDPTVVVLLGEIAFRGAGFKDYKPIKDCGHVLKYVQCADACPYVLSVHPAYVLRQEMKPLHLLRRAMKAAEEQLEGRRERRFKCLSDLGEIENWLFARQRKLCAVDLETSQLEPKGGQVLTCAVCDGKQTVWFPLFHPGYEATAKIRLKRLRLLKDWWSLGPRVVHNAMMELSWFRAAGAGDPGVLYDTMLQQWLLDENNPKGLDYLVTTVLCEPPYWNQVDYDQSFAHQKLADVGTLNAHDAEKTFKLHKIQRQRMTSDMHRIHDRILSPLAGVLVSMRERGIAVNRAKLTALQTQIQRRASTLENKFRKTFGVPDLNFRSPKQLAALLYGSKKRGGLGLDPPAYTDTGLGSTDDAAVGKLALIEPRVRVLHEIKSLKTLMSGALTQWLHKLDDQDILRTEYNIGHVVTGRPSSSNPNLMNIDRPMKPTDPAYWPWKGCQRTVLVSRFKGGKLVQLDYKAQEYRIMMAVVGQWDVLDRVAAGEDSHTLTQQRIKARGHDLSRDISKNSNFALIYHADENVLYLVYNVPLEIGRLAVAAWHEVHPRVHVYHNFVEKEIRTKGYIESIFGWRRRIKKDANQHELNQAINFPGQNPGALITYMALIEADKALARYETVIIHTNYDSITLDVPKGELRVTPPLVAKIMESQSKKLKEFCSTRLKRTIPLAVDIKIGDHM